MIDGPRCVNRGPDLVAGSPEVFRRCGAECSALRRDTTRHAEEQKQGGNQVLSTENHLHL
jgi:hypothetical protein